MKAAKAGIEWWGWKTGTGCGCGADLVVHVELGGVHADRNAGRAHLLNVRALRHRGVVVGDDAHIQALGLVAHQDARDAIIGDGLGCGRKTRGVECNDLLGGSSEAVHVLRQRKPPSANAQRRRCAATLWPRPGR